MCCVWVCVCACVCVCVCVFVSACACLWCLGLWVCGLLCVCVCVCEFCVLMGLWVCWFRVVEQVFLVALSRATFREFLGFWVYRHANQTHTCTNFQTHTHTQKHTHTHTDTKIRAYCVCVRVCARVVWCGFGFVGGNKWHICWRSQILDESQQCCPYKLCTHLSVCAQSLFTPFCATSTSLWPTGGSSAQHRPEV